MNLPCIHIGLPKAASTTLQRGLFDNHPDIYYLGKSTRKRGEYEGPESEDLSNRLNDPLSGASRAVLRRAFRDTITPRAAGRSIVLSREGLAGGGGTRARHLATNIHEILGPARLLVVLREPRALMESLYFQRLRGNNARRAERNKEELIGYFTFDEWLDEARASPRGGHLQLLQAADMLDAHVRMLGRENVGVLAFEQLVEGPEDFLRRVCEFVGVDASEGVRRAAAVHHNPRMTTAHVERLKRLGRNPRRAALMKQGNAKTCSRLMGLTAGHRCWDAPKARAQLSPVWQDRLREYTAGQYGQIAAEWNLPLERYGYPV